jgi:hypothetical protein
MGNKRLAINSSALEDKNMGVQMLYQYTTDMVRRGRKGGEKGARRGRVGGE